MKTQIHNYFTISRKISNGGERYCEIISNSRVSDFLKDWMLVNPAELRRRRQGVYLIGDFYIGVTNNFRGRISAHLRLLAREVHPNKDFQERFLRLLAAGKAVPLKIISDISTFEKEAELIEAYKKLGFPLVNKEFVPSKKYTK